MFHRNPGRGWVLILAIGACVSSAQADEPKPKRRMERLGRGVVAVRQDDGKVFVSWRITGEDPEGLAFNVYRAVGQAAPTKLNPQPLTAETCHLDAAAEPGQTLVYTVRAVEDGRESAPSAPFTLRPGDPAGYLEIPLKTPPGYTPNDAAVGDLDGDGEYEIVLKQQIRSMSPPPKPTIGTLEPSP